ncbi:hypothetical protein B0H13DRAFT_2344993 [Mycena leptocephala]|nr:hypothetical protein B0H13DRAFT_2344993 [Mycena leptocephala]
MAKLKLDVIKRGLTSFQGTLKSKKDALLARLARKEKISDEEEHWLDNDATMWTNALLDVMKQMERTGVLQTANILDLEELVNMPEEQVREQLTDEEIKNAVQEKRAGEQDREVNGGDDDNYVDKDPRPTRGEVLQASAILRRYVRESGDTFARQMETILVRTDLIPFVRVFFAPGVIQMVEKTFDYYDIEALPRSNLYSCALHIFAEYIVRCSAAGDVGGASSGEGTGAGAGAGGPSRGGGEGGGDGAAPGGGNDPSGAFPQATGPFGPSARRTISTVFQSPLATKLKGHILTQ